MNYRSVSDLADLINRYASKIPHDVDLVVGIPRSGTLVASIISLKLNLPLTDLYSFHRNDELKKGNTRTYKHAELVNPWNARKILLVDDSIASGNSMLAAAEVVRSVYQGQVVTMAAFAQKENTGVVDLYLETVEQPRLFEWNILHHNLMRHACLDIDGVSTCSQTHTNCTTTSCVWPPSRTLRRCLRRQFMSHIYSPVVLNASVRKRSNGFSATGCSMVSCICAISQGR